MHKNFQYQELKSIHGGGCVHLLEEEEVSFGGHILKIWVYFDEKAVRFFWGVKKRRWDWHKLCVLAVMSTHQ